MVGYSSRDAGLHADEVAFLGSPGVGVDHARDLGVPPEHVWAGTSRDDEIHFAVDGDPRTWGGFPDQHWYGMNPADPAFGGNQIPSSPTTRHNDYWKDPQTVDALARIVVGRAEGTHQ
ncbi:hypothetical protein GCM10011581_13190 [Saccharopolyspora subtropica]|uniref:DUF1023 domain-containing protein n=1 Tax=Saccharopolyspora thermophila TaxID=89367 RepID=A0A917JMY3_9PSEU|nr:hypothetical protein GCM10011581_13190 [Saccharopolyspora subtropica]